jgi:hypothetical protein
MSYVLENEAALRAVPVNTSVIPAYCNSFLEAGEYAEAAINEAFNDMMNSIGINELYIYESTGSMVIYEEDEQAAKDLGEKKEFFVKRAWGVIKGLFERFLGWLKQKAEDLKNSIGTNITNKLAGKLDKINDDVVISKGFPVKFYEKRKDFTDLVLDVISGVEKLSETLSDLKNDDEIADTTKVKKYQDYDDGPKIDPAKERLASFIGNDNITRENIQDIRKTIKDFSEIKSLSPVDKKWVRANIEDIFKNIINKGDERTIKALYNESKKTINSYMKSARDIERKINKGQEKKYQVHSVSYIKTGLTVLSNTISATTDVYSKFINHSIGLSIKVVGAKNPKVKDDKKKEESTETDSTVGESAINIVRHENVIDEIFAW